MQLIEKARCFWRGRRNEARWALMRSAGGMLLLRAAGIALTFLSSVIMARMLGTHNYGLYAYVIAIASVLSLLAALGVPQYLVREGAGRPEGALYLLRWADRRVLSASVLMGLVMLLGAWLESDMEQSGLFALAAFIPLLSSLSEVRRSLLQASGWVVRGHLATLLFVPLVMLIGLAALWCLNAGAEVWQIMALTVAAALLPCVINDLQLRSVTLAGGSSDSASQIPISLWVAMRFMWLGVLYVLLSRTDLIMLGLLSDSSSVGIYAVSSRAAEIVSVVLLASNMVIAPKIAKLYRNGELEKLQQLLTATMKVVVYASLPLVFVLFFGAGWLLSVFYGEAYADGALVLRLLVLAQFVLVLGGPLGTTLEMTGNEKACLVVMVWVVSINAVLNALMIPEFGANGASIATCVSVIVGRLLLWQKVRQSVLLRPTASGG